MKAKIQGHCNYYGVTDNRRSQKKSFNWDKFMLFLKVYPLPKAKTYVNIFEFGAGSSYLRK